MASSSLTPQGQNLRSETSKGAKNAILSSGNLGGSLAHKKRGRKSVDRRSPSQISPLQDRQKRDERYHAPKRRMATHSQEMIQQAIDEYLTEGETLSELSRKYNIPMSTLHDKLKQKHKNPRGRPCVLSEDMERDLAHVVVNFCERGSVMFLSELSEIAVAYAQQRSIDNFKGTSKWRKEFISRWNLEKWTEGKRKVLGIHRRISAREDIVEEFIQKLNTHFRAFLSALAESLGKAIAELTHDDIAPAIFAMDETSLGNRTPMKYEPQKVVKKSGVGSIQCLQSVCHGQSTVCATLLEVFRADGTSPFHWLTTKHSLSDEQKVILEGLNPETKLTFITLDSGKFNSELHAKTLVEIGRIRQNKPTFVIQDTPNMHKTDDSIITASQENIFLLGLPTNSSWFLQQADDLPFLLNKSEHYRRVRDYRAQHGKCPDLFHTIKIYLEARKKVVTSDVITDSFRRVGQYNKDILGPDINQIRRKAALARMKCSGTESWEESADLSPQTHIERQRLTELSSAVNQNLTELEMLRTTVTNLRNSCGSYSLELHNLIEQKSRLKQALNDADAALEAAELAASRVEVNRRAQLPQIEDPSIVQSIDQRDFRVADLSYLEEQRDLLRLRIENLTKTIREEKNSPSGTILASGSDSVSLPRIVTARKNLMIQLKKKISDLHSVREIEEKDKKKCLGDCAKLRRKSNNATLCKHCNLGYCRKCSQNFSLTTHESSCAKAPPELDTTTTNYVSLELTQDPEVIEDPTRHDDAEPPEVDSISAPQTVPKPNVAKPTCRYCGKTSSVLTCLRGHLRCNQCKAFCNSCSRRSRVISGRY